MTSPLLTSPNPIRPPLPDSLHRAAHVAKAVGAGVDPGGAADGLFGEIIYYNQPSSMQLRSREAAGL